MAGADEGSAAVAAYLREGEVEQALRTALAEQAVAALTDSQVCFKFYILGLLDACRCLLLTPCQHCRQQTVLCRSCAAC